MGEWQEIGQENMLEAALPSPKNPAESNLALNCPSQAVAVRSSRRLINIPTVKKALLLCLSMVLVFGQAFSHDEKFHHGKPVLGTITSLSEGGFELKNDAGITKVTLQPSTKFEDGDKTVDRSALKAGIEVSAFGTKLESGELVAKEVRIGSSSVKHEADQTHHHS